MAWQKCVDNHIMGSQCITKACIVGLDGSICASSEEFSLTKEEVQKLITGFSNRELFIKSGVTLSGNKYIYLSGTDRVVRAKRCRIGVHCVKTMKVIIVSLYEAPVQPQRVASVVEKLGELLITYGY